jgi:hypothetical protein
LVRVRFLHVHILEVPDVFHFANTMEDSHVSWEFRFWPPCFEQNTVASSISTKFCSASPEPY